LNESENVRMADADPAGVGAEQRVRADFGTPHLDALRILASAGIVILHYSNYVDDIPVGRFIFQHTFHFNFFVDLFFAISGFVIAKQYLSRVSDRHEIGRFLWRRLARIYPLHIATLAFYVVIAVLLYFGTVHVDNPDRYPLSDIPAQVLLLHAIDGQRLTFNFPSWSLSAEMACYLLFPLIAFAGLRSPKLIVFLAAAIAAGLTTYCVVSGVPLWPNWINHGGALRAIPAFMLGVALHLFRGRLTHPRIGMALLPGLLIFVFLGWALPVIAALMLVYLIVVAAVHCDETGRKTLLSRSGVGRWAHLTYSSYMLHMPVATVIVTVLGRLLLPHWTIGRFGLLVLAVVVLALLSAASYRLFEDPVRRRMQTAWDRWSARPPATVLAPSERGAR
jgi:peptidoglycan/LPS O-acetylase OafA/YrhL